ncbi:MAG: secretin and TonB N-terminal domain-containing protein [Deltaproteobacteria bacterium]|nr:secretin and TonB N-terminal domain-containing protein [Deltaproteobacteria bacterium]
MNLNLGRVLGSGFLLFAIFVFLIAGCSTPPETTVDVADTTPRVAVIESVRTDATPNQAIITFVCSKKTTHGDPFAVANPARISFDIKGTPARDLPDRVTFKLGPVKEILIKEKKAGISGVVVYVRHERNHSRLIKRGKDIVLEITPKITEKGAVEKRDAAASSLAQILDVTVTQRKGNRTRLSVKTDKEVKYDVKLDRTVLIINLNNGRIQPDLLKELDSEHAAGAVNRVNAFYSALDHHISLRVTLRKLVPYHITQDGKVLNIDFDAVPGEVPLVAGRPASKAPLKKTESSAVKKAFGKDKGSGSAKPLSRAGLFEATSKQYAGQKMSFDFVDTDIRNILQLISEVAGINIVWGSDVEGKISMKLDNIPWDQALEMILKPNGLTYQIEDDVLWVVPKEKLRDMEIKEGKRKGALMAAKRLQGIFEAKIIEFITIRNRKASDIFRMLVGDPNADPPIPPALDIEAAESEEKEEGEEEKGKKVKISTLDLYLSYDPGTNMIIANGVRAKVDKVKELIAKLDVAEKQVMIEARVVDAVTTFTRDLGIQWQSLDIP